MLYCSWDMVCGRCNYFSFWAIFCRFNPLTVPKMKIKKNEKKIPGNIITLHKCNKNHDHMLYSSWYMVHNGYNYYFSFWAIFALLPTLTAKKIKIFKKWKKNPWRYHFTHVCQKLWIDNVQFLRYGAQQMAGQKSDAQRWCP